MLSNPDPPSQQGLVFKKSRRVKATVEAGRYQTYIRLEEA